jgi:phospholipase/carboxylesterase
MTRYRHIFLDAGDGDGRSLVMLHGTGGDEVSFAELGRALSPSAAVLAVRGDVEEHGMARFFRRRAEGVYDMDDLARRTAALAGFIRDALHEHGRDPALGTGIGYSNGANVLANILFTEPDTLGAAVLMHPLIPFEPAPQPGLAGKPVLVTSGRNDPICPPPATDFLEDWLARQGAAVTRHRHAGGHEVRPDEIEAVRAWLPGA